MSRLSINQISVRIDHFYIRGSGTGGSPGYPASRCLALLPLLICLAPMVSALVYAAGATRSAIVTVVPRIDRLK